MPKRPKFRPHDIIVLTILLSINFLLFLPGYLFHIRETSLLPFYNIFAGQDIYRWVVSAVGWRFNFDPFRISIEYLLVVSLLIALPVKRLKWSSIIATCIFIFLLFYQVYYSAFKSIYLTEPLFLNDIHYIKLGMEIAFNDLGWKLLLFPVILFAIIYLIYKLHFYVFAKVKEGKHSIFVLSILGILFLVSSINLFRYGTDSKSEHVFQLISGNITNNITRSKIAGNELENFQMDKYLKNNKFVNFRIMSKPNIHFLYIESYGRIVYDNPDISDNYKDIILDLQRNLDESGWSATSGMLTSPISGGASWIAYASTFYGLNIKNQATYEVFLKDSTFRKYPGLFNYLRGQGYTSYWLSAIKPPEQFSVPWQIYEKFYGVDEFIKYADLKFTGELIGFGPAPPDQYSLSFAMEKIKREESGPYSLFFITQNSHNPFYSPEKPVEDWKTLNKGISNQNNSINFMDVPELGNYIKSIRYELETVGQIIREYGGDDDLFIVLGDHQPPGLSFSSDAKGTPIHIITKNKCLLEGFSEYGFNSGFVLENTGEIMGHAGLYSCLLRELIAQDTSRSALPPFQPGGWIPK